MYENLINQLNFYIKQKETSASTMLGRMVGSALHEECNTLSAAVQAINTLSEFHDAVMINKLEAKSYFVKAEDILHHTLKEFVEKLVDTFTQLERGHEGSTISFEDVSGAINSWYSEFDKRKYFVSEDAGDNDG